MATQMVTSTTLVDVDDLNIPVSTASLKESLKSVTHWEQELPKFAEREQNKADTFAIVAGVFAAVTAAAILPVTQDGAPTWQRLLVTAMPLIAAVCAVFPNVRKYSETATLARELTAEYGPLVGAFEGALDPNKHSSQAELHKLMKKFHQVKAKKDQLHRLPPRHNKRH